MGESGFESMNYRDLQRLAKTAGVKANLPKGELIKALQESAANDSMEDSKIVSGEESGGAALNSTFDLDKCNDDTPPAERDDTATVLNRTFELKEVDSASPRRSNRLSVGPALKSSLELETRHSPAAQAFSASQSSLHLSVPLRKQTPRVENLRKETPRTSRGKIAKTPRPGTTSTPASGIKITRTPASGLKSVSKRPGSQKKPETTTHIPRFVKFARKVPDFSKMHEREFKKMESLDSYLEKKQKRADTAAEQMLKARTLAEEHSRIKERLKFRTPGASFIPTVTSVSKMNLNFGGGKTPNGGAKKPFQFSAVTAVVSVKKPERTQAGVKALTKDKPKPVGAVAPVRVVPATPLAEVLQTPSIKPLLNITNKSALATPSSARKAFDLKASLAKPLGYKPHAGKLPLWGQKKKVTELRNMSTKEVMEKTRNIIRGVRMNKRAALLLQNRNMSD